MKINWNPTHPDQALVIVDEASFEKKYPGVAQKSILERTKSGHKFCRALLWQGVFSATMVIPKKEHPIQERITFSLVLDRNVLFVVRGNGDIRKLLESFFEHYDTTFDDPMEFLMAFLSYLIQSDVYYLEEYNEKLEGIEEEMLSGKSSNMERFVMTTRKDMNTLGDYYLQLSAVAQSIQEAIIKDNGNDSQLSALVSLYSGRVNQLLGMVESIKDYTSQIWNLRQTQLSDKQNQISQVLTIITVVFLPLTLITGWFGMNFVHMPLIRTSMGYHITEGLCILIVVLELWYIWKQKLWK